LILSETGQAACSNSALRAGSQRERPGAAPALGNRRADAEAETMIFGEAPEAAGDAAEALFREIVRRARD
jgi:hypothetical protein